MKFLPTKKTVPSFFSALSRIAIIGALCVTPAAADDHGAHKDDTSKYGANELFAFEHVSCTGAPGEVRVVVKGVKKSVGLIVADLYRNDPEGFLKRKGRVQQVRFAAKAPHSRFCMKAPLGESGESDYAIALYHDKNANRTLDRGPLGIPNEPFGLSNDPKIRFSAPKIKETLFHVASEGANVEIKLNN